MKRILITGANSYIGTSVGKYLAQWPEQYQVDTADTIDGSWHEKDFSGYDSVFHVAGIAHINTKKLDQAGRDRYWKVNAELPAEVAGKAKKEGVGQFIFLSSMSVYGEHGSIKNPVTIAPDTRPAPRDLYGKSKLAAEKNLQSLHDSSFAVCILRPPMIYGPGCKGNYPALARFARVSPFFPQFSNERSMLFIDNLSIFVRWLIDSQQQGLFLPRNQEAVNTGTLVQAIAAFHGRRIALTRIFNPLLRFLSGRVSVVDKVLGGLVYQGEENMGRRQGIRYVDFSASIIKTEEHSR